VDFACPLGITGVVALALKLAAEIEQFDYVYATLRALSLEKTVCFWGVAHGFGWLFDGRRNSRFNNMSMNMRRR
jgi:hypothetical protein